MENGPRFKDKEPWNQARATFFLVAGIIAANVFYAGWLIAGCTYLKVKSVDVLGDFTSEPCANFRGDIRDLLFEMLSIGLAMMGGISAGREISRRGKSDDDKGGL
jgi:hypothetical protein